VSLLLVIVVLLQSGKAADLAGAFGGMGSQSTFGPRGSASFLSKMTTTLAVLFMVTSLGLWIINANRSGPASAVDGIKQEPAATTTAPESTTQPPATTTTTNEDTATKSGENVTGTTGTTGTQQQAEQPAAATETGTVQEDKASSSGPKESGQDKTSADESTGSETK